MASSLPDGVQLAAASALPDAARTILTPDALAFVATLHRAFNPTRKRLLLARALRQQELDAGKLPAFLPETAHIRNNPAWQGARPAPGLVDRRVEITGPVDRKMVINALNSGASTFMADFEDSSSPTWENMVMGQVNLRDAINRTITFQAGAKSYKLREDGKIATLLVRPRGWHLDEKHLLIDGEPCSASIFDFGLYFFYNAWNAVKLGHGPYFYLPKMESHLEARLWNDIFNMAQDAIGMPRGTIRGTVLIETILAAFEMDEIIYELREHSSGLNCGRWDYIFSYIKKLRNHPQFVLPARAHVTMTTGFMDAYVRLLIKTCHARGVAAMGGMAAQIPSKDPEINAAAMEKVRNDKLREARAGHDGTWVAHPDLIKVAREVFDEHMPGPHQMHVRRLDVKVTASDLLSPPAAIPITEQDIRSNLSVGLMYTEAWLRGAGCVPIHNLMEDAATAEIARSQVWQWVRHAVRTDKGRTITAEYVRSLLDDEVAKLQQAMGAEKFAKSKIPAAKQYMWIMVQGKEFPEFLTTLCYDAIATTGASKSRL